MKRSLPPLLLLLALFDTGWQTSLQSASNMITVMRELPLDFIADMQVTIPLKNNSTVSFFVLNKNGKPMPHQLRLRATPCGCAVDISFSKIFLHDRRGFYPKVSDVSDPIIVEKKGGLDPRLLHELTSAESQSLLLEPGGRSFQVHVKQLPLPGTDGSLLPEARLLLRVGQRQGLDLGWQKYKLKLCDEAGAFNLRSKGYLALPTHEELRVCVVANTRRPLPNFCSAQAAIGNRLRPRNDQLMGYTIAQRLPRGSVAFNCTPYRMTHDGLHWSLDMPTVAFNAFNWTRSSVVYFDAFVFRTDEDGQADSVSWKTLTYVNSHPVTGAAMPLAACGDLNSGDGHRTLLRQTSPGVFESSVLLQLPPNAGLLLEPDTFDLLSSGYEAELTSYSTQSLSAHFRTVGLSCSDRLWTYGAALCGTRLNQCLMGDSACQFDTVRLKISLRHKTRSLQPLARHTSSRWDEWLASRRIVRWKFFLKSFHGTDADTTQPRIGRIHKAMELIANLTKWNTDLAKVKSLEKLKLLKDRKANKRTLQAVERAAIRARRMNRTLAACDVSLVQRHFNGSTRQLMKAAFRCYKRLLRVHSRVRLDCSPSHVSLAVKIMSTANSEFTSMYTSGMNRYKVIVYKLNLQRKVKTKLQRLQERHQRAMKKQAQYKRIVRSVEARLLKTMVTGKLPDNANQGFNGSNLRGPIHSMKLRGIENYDGTDHAVIRLRLRAIRGIRSNRVDLYVAYVYALERATRQPLLPSLFGFHVERLDADRVYDQCGP